MFRGFKTLISSLSLLSCAALSASPAKAEITYRFYGEDHNFSDVGKDGTLPPSYFPIYSVLLQRVLCDTLLAEMDLATAANYWADRTGTIHVSQTCDYVLNGDERFVAVAFDATGAPIAHADAYRVLLDSGVIQPLSNAEMIATVVSGPVYYSEATLSDWPEATPLSFEDAERACRKGTFYPMFQIQRRGTNLPMTLAGCTLGKGEDEILVVAFDSAGAAMVTNQAAYRDLMADTAADLLAKRAPGTFQGMTLVALDADDFATLGHPDITSGLLVTEVDMASPAWERWFRPNQLIVEAERKPITTVADLEAARANAVAEGKDSMVVLVMAAGKPRLMALPVE